MSSAEGDLTAPELHLRLRQQERVADFGRFAMRTDNLQSILHRASEIAAEGLHTTFAKVLEYLPAEQDFVVRAGVGWRPGVVGHARVPGNSHSPAGHAFKTGRPVISNALANEERFRTPELLAEHGISSAINVLVQIGDDEPYGVLEADSTYRDDFTQHDAAFLQALANSLATALDMQRRQSARDEMLRDKEALLQANQALLRDKDLLMQEVHHRVRNSLQLVRTILTMQARAAANPEAKAQIDIASGRIMAIAAVHHRLYAGGSIQDADAADYLRGLLTDMRDLVPEAAGRPLDLRMDKFNLPADDLTALGLITAELVTNALKHGSGRIHVDVHRQAAGLEVAVSDEGDGFAPDFDPAARTGLGMRMVAALSKMPQGEAVRVDRTAQGGRLVVRLAFGGSPHAPGRT